MVMVKASEISHVAALQSEEKAAVDYIRQHLMSQLDRSSDEYYSPSKETLNFWMFLSPKFNSFISRAECNDDKKKAKKKATQKVTQEAKKHNDFCKLSARPRRPRPNSIDTIDTFEWFTPLDDFKASYFYCMDFYLPNSPYRHEINEKFVDLLETVYESIQKKEHTFDTSLGQARTLDHLDQVLPLNNFFVRKYLPYLLICYVCNYRTSHLTYQNSTFWTYLFSPNSRPSDDAGTLVYDRRKKQIETFCRQFSFPPLNFQNDHEISQRPSPYTPFTTYFGKDPFLDPQCVKWLYEQLSSSIHDYFSEHPSSDFIFPDLTDCDDLFNYRFQESLDSNHRRNHPQKRRAKKKPSSSKANS